MERGWFFNRGKKRVNGSSIDTDLLEYAFSLLQERFPEVALHLLGLEEEVQDYEISSVNIPQDIAHVQNLIICGLEKGVYFEALEEWLKEDLQRKIIFLEDDIREILLFLRSDCFERFLQSAQVSLRYAWVAKPWEELLFEVAYAPFAGKIELLASPIWQKKNVKRFMTLRKKFWNAICHGQACLLENFFVELIAKNHLTNIQHAESSTYINALDGSFSGVPAIICGAGPSLSNDLSCLKEIASKALIFAGGSAFTALSKKGIRPHCAIAMDPNEDEYMRFKASQGFDVPLFFSSRIHPGVLDITNPPKGYMVIDSGNPLENYLHQEGGFHLATIGNDLSYECNTVTSLAISLAIRMGCFPILLCGVDLSYQNQKRYSDGVTSYNHIEIKRLKEEFTFATKLVQRKNRIGKRVYTNSSWVMEAKGIGALVKKYASIPIFNASLEGLPIMGIDYLSSSDFIKKFCNSEFDIRGKLHSLMLLHRTPGNSLSNQYKTSLSSSALRCENLILEIIKELNKTIQDSVDNIPSAKQIVCQMDLEDEVIYKLVLLKKHRSLLETLEFKKAFILQKDPSSIYIEQVSICSSLLQTVKEIQKLVKI